MKIYPSSKIDNTNVLLAASTTATNYNANNVKSSDLTIRWRSTGRTSENIVCFATSGYQECGLSSKEDATETGLSTTTVYSFKVAEDEETLTPYTIETEADITFAAVIILLNTATSGVCTWSLSDGDLICTSDTYGTTSRIRMTGGTTGTDLFATLTDFSALETPINGYGISNPTVAILDGHNLTVDAVVQIQGNATDSWGSPTVDITMTRGINGIYYAITGFSDLKYWRFVFADISNPDGYIEVGRLWLGHTTALLGASRTTTEKIIDTTIKSWSRSGQAYTDIGYRYKEYNVDFPYWTNTNKDAIEDFINEVHGSPFYVAFDETNLTLIPLLYAVLGDSVDYTNISALTSFNGKLSFREAF